MSGSRRDFTSALFGAAPIPLACAGGSEALNRAGAVVESKAAEMKCGLALYNLRDQGAKGDGTTLETEVIQRTIDRSAAAGGGIVYLPPGDYLTGTITLRSNVTLYLEAGAVLWGSKHRADYANEYLIYAQDAVNVSLRGRGAIDGNGIHFWKRRENRWVAGNWRPWTMLRFVRCENLLIEDVTIRNSPMWTIHPIDCDRVAIRGISILNDVAGDRGPNTDGIDPDGCTRVRISDCYIQSGDDSIVLKNRDTKRGYCRDITVTNCVLVTGESALKIGSDSHGEFRNITFSNCAIRDAGCGIGLWLRAGGLVDGWTISNIAMTLTGGGQPIYFWTGKEEDGVPPGRLKSVRISHVTADADGAMFISGLPERHLEDIHIENVRIHMRGGRAARWHENPPLPFDIWSHRYSPFDIYCRHIDKLTLRDVELEWNTPEKPEWGSAIRCRYVGELDLDRFRGRQATGSHAAAVDLFQVKHAFVHNTWAVAGCGTFLHVGDGTGSVSLMANDLSRAGSAASFGAGVNRNILHETSNRMPEEHG
jgi:hypothetical protein